MNPILFLSPLIAFVCTFILTKRWIPVAHRAGLVGHDMNKPNRPKVAEMGGIPLLGGVLGGILSYVGINTFILGQSTINLALFAATSTVLIIAFIGVVDDLLGWKIGLKQWQKPLLTVPAAIPMMVANLGRSVVSLPVFGDVNLGLLYPFLAVPVGIVGASNGFNMLAGYNGLEAGMGIVIISAMTFVAYYTGSSWVAMVGAVAVASLLAFLYFNWYPAKIFPGNAFTYMVGTIMACMAILGNMEKLALVLFIPYYMDFVFFLRNIKGEAFGKVNEDGTLDKPFDKICDLAHLMIVLIKKIRGKVYEKDVTTSIILFEAILALIGIKLYI
ncbi:MAG: glycosyl transferase family 4 [Candidatus Methanomethylicia archaeon]|nr:glycosyl transferase family 4 [Candidatus Methanomethylicia archaeon]